MEADEAEIRSQHRVMVWRRLDLVKLYSDVTDWIRFVFGCRPTIGGKYCLGERKRFRSCNIDVSIAALYRHHYRQHTIIKIMTIAWFNLFCVWSLHGTLLARVCCACTPCVYAVNLRIYYMCVPATGVPCRLSGFPRDSVLRLWQRSLPGKILHLEAIQRGWVSKAALFGLYMCDFIYSMVIFTADGLWHHCEPEVITTWVLYWYLWPSGLLVMITKVRSLKVSYGTPYRWRWQSYWL